jgi:CRISPR-associated protein Cmr5
MPDVGIPQTQEQKRANFAWEKVDKVPDKGKYKAVVQKFPSMVLNNGLGQALAFLLAKGTDKTGTKLDESKEHGQLYQHLETWLCVEKKIVPKGEGSFGLMSGLIKQDSTRYRHATMEALALAAWLKRFAEALAPED